MIKTFANFINVDEGNAFTAALKKAQESGAEEFEFEGKTFKTKGNQLKEEENAPEAPVKKLGKLKTFEEYVKEKDNKAETSDETPEDNPEVDKEVKKQEDTDAAKSKEDDTEAEEVDAEEIADADSEEADELVDDAKDED